MNYNIDNLFNKEKIFMKLCPKCKAGLADDVKFCSNCGYAFKETVVKTAPAVTEKSAKDLFDHKPLVMEWYENSSFARFLFKIWPKLKVFTIVFSLFCAFMSMFLMQQHNQGFDAEKMQHLDTFMGGLIIISSFALALYLVVNTVNMIFHNELKKFLFSSFLRKKGIDLNIAAKYVFNQISVDNFSSIPKKEKADLAAWLESPQYFGEAVMMAQRSSAKKKNIVWMCVLTAITFSFASTVFSLLEYFIIEASMVDFNAGWDSLSGFIFTCIVGFVYLIISCIIIVIISIIGTKRRSAIKRAWAVSVITPEVQNVEVISA